MSVVSTRHFHKKGKTIKIGRVFRMIVVLSESQLKIKTMLSRDEITVP